jgi:hypothetical protein
MHERLFMARLFLIGGGMLAIIGFILWFVLPIKLVFPPFLLTTLLALGYGACCLGKGQPTTSNKHLRPTGQKIQSQPPAERRNGRAASKDRS